MRQASTAIPLEKIVCFSMAGIVALLVVWQYMLDPIEIPTENDLIPRIKTNERPMQWREPYAAAERPEGHWNDPFAPEEGGLRHMRDYTIPYVPPVERRPTTTGGAQGTPTPPPITPPPTGSQIERVNLPALPRPPAPQTSTNGTRPPVNTDDDEQLHEEEPSVPQLPPVVAIVRLDESTYRAMIRPDDWSPGSVAYLVKGDEWLYGDDHFKIIAVTAKEVIVKDPEGRQRVMKVNAETPEEKEPISSNEIERLRILSELMTGK